jgi:hypothetical protein
MEPQFHTKAGKEHYEFELACCAVNTILDLAQSKGSATKALIAIASVCNQRAEEHDNQDAGHIGNLLMRAITDCQVATKPMVDPWHIRAENKDYVIRLTVEMRIAAPNEEDAIEVATRKIEKIPRTHCELDNIEED